MCFVTNFCHNLQVRSLFRADLTGPEITLVLRLFGFVFLREVLGLPLFLLFNMIYLFYIFDLYSIHNYIHMFNSFDKVILTRTIGKNMLMTVKLVASHIAITLDGKI